MIPQRTLATYLCASRGEIRLEEKMKEEVRMEGKREESTGLNSDPQIHIHLESQSVTLSEIGKKFFARVIS